MGHGSRRKITNSQIDTDMKPNNERPLARNPHQVRSLLAIACAIILISFRSAYATDIPCSDLETASADELLATVDPKSIQDGGKSELENTAVTITRDKRSATGRQPSKTTEC